VERIYADHIKRIDTTLAELGKRTLIWGDIIIEFPKILDQLPPHILIGAWNYDPLESFAAFIDPIKNAGFDFTVSPGILNSNRLFPDFREAFVNIRNFINEGYDKGTSGVYCTIWDDGGPHFFNHVWYGVAYAAEQAWRPNRDEFSDFDRRFSLAFYRDPANAVPEGMKVLNKLTELGPTCEMNELIFGKILLPQPGKTISYNLGEWAEVRSITTEAKNIFSQAAATRYQGDLAFLTFVCDQYLFLSDSREALYKASKSYQEAISSQEGDPDKTAQMMSEVRDLVSVQANSFKELSSEFTRLWNLESRPHWFETATEIYNRRNQLFNRQLILIDQAVVDYRSGEPLPPASEVMLDIREHADQYFQFWLLCGVFPLSNPAEAAEDFLKSMGGEAGARPYPGMGFVNDHGRLFRWHKFDSPYRHIVELDPYFGTPGMSVAYAYCTLDSREDKTFRAYIAYHDGATVYCNGEKILEDHDTSSPRMEEREIQLPLKEGRNHLLLKIDRIDSAWDFSFRLEGEKVRNHKQKYYIQ
jgi:hypothetical protein